VVRHGVEQGPALKIEPTTEAELEWVEAYLNELGLEWVVATDEHGTEIAVHGEPGDLLVFPPNLVAKRFERGETRFLASVYDELVHRTRQLRVG